MHQHTIWFQLPGDAARERPTTAENDLIEQLETEAHVAVDVERDVTPEERRDGRFHFVHVVRHTKSERIDAVRAFCEAHGWSVTGYEE